MFANIVRSHKNSGLIGVDVLQNFIDSQYTDEHSMSDDEIIGLLIALLFGASLEFKHHHLDGSLSTQP
jgi:hypothetical protein